MRTKSMHTLCFVVAIVIVTAGAGAQSATEKMESPALAELPAVPTVHSAPQKEEITAIGSFPDTGPITPVHKFWDRENSLLFAGVGASRALDYSSTLNLRRRGLDEILLTNSVVDNHPLFGGIEAAATVASIGISYVFHRTGHHRLERWTSAVHIGVATGGAVRNYALKTHPN